MNKQQCRRGLGPGRGYTFPLWDGLLARKVVHPWSWWVRTSWGTESKKGMTPKGESGCCYSETEREGDRLNQMPMSQVLDLTVILFSFGARKASMHITTEPLRWNLGPYTLLNFHVLIHRARTRFRPDTGCKHLARYLAHNQYSIISSQSYPIRPEY